MDEPRCATPAAEGLPMIFAAVPGFLVRRWRRSVAVLLGAGLLLVMASVPDAAAQTTALMRLDGIPGTSLLDDFTDYVDITGYATGVRTDVELKGGGTKLGKKFFGPVEVTKAVNAADPPLFTRAASGGPIATGCITTLALGPETKPLAAIGLANVFVQALSPVLAPDGEPRVSVGLSYERIAIIAFRYNELGGLAGTDVSCWDAAKNVSCGTDALGCTGLQ
jgi:type VI protein secretion system component Hcp